MGINSSLSVCLFLSLLLSHFLSYSYSLSYSFSYSLSIYICPSTVYVTIYVFSNNNKKSNNHTICCLTNHLSSLISIFLCSTVILALSSSVRSSKIMMGILCNTQGHTYQSYILVHNYYTIYTITIP